MKSEALKVLITGGGGGIGSAIGGELAKRGASVLLVDRDASALQAAANILRRSGTQCETLVADLTAENGLMLSVEQARRSGINVLINNAGLNHFRLFRDQTAAQLDAALAVNVRVPMQLCHALLPQLLGEPHAAIVNIGSVFGSIGYPGYAAYSATKFALRGFSEALRRELADTNVRVHYIAPRATRTPINSTSVEQMNRELKVAMDPPERVAEAVCAALSGRGGESIIGWPENMFTRLNALLPGVVDRAIRRQLPVIQRYARQAPPVAPNARPRSTPEFLDLRSNVR